MAMFKLEREKKPWRVLLDTCVLVDVTTKREPFFQASKNVYGLAFFTEQDFFMTTMSFTDLYYVARRYLGQEKTQEELRRVLSVLEVLPVGRKNLLAMFEAPLFDAEDAVQEDCAASNEIDYIVTRNVKDYRGSRVKAVTPEEFLALVQEN